VIEESSVLETRRRDELVLGVAMKRLTGAIEAPACVRGDGALVSSGLVDRSEPSDEADPDSADAGRSERE